MLAILSDFKTVEEKNLLLDALDAGKSLSTVQMMRVVRIVYLKALESSANAYSMTWLAFLIMEKDASHLFLESLLTCCREWLGQQEADMRRKSKTSDGLPAFLSFLREVYAAIQSRKTRVQPPDVNHNVSDSQAAKHSQSLANLILDCGILLTQGSRTKDTNYALHVESVVNTIRCLGVYLEQDNQFKVEQLLMVFRRVLLSDVVRVSSMCKKNLMEAIECKASNWIFSPSQQASMRDACTC